MTQRGVHPAPPPESPASKARTSRRIGFALKVGVAALLVYLVASAVDWGEFLKVARHLQVTWLFAVAVVTLLDRAWMAGKWYYLLRALGVATTFLQSLWHYLLGGLVGTAMQWQLGGDIARALGLGHRSGQKHLVVTSLIVEKIVGAAANGLLALVAVTMLALTVELGPLGVLVLPCAVICVLAMGTPLILLSPFVLSIVEKLVGRLPQRWRQKFNVITDAAQSLARLGNVALVFFVLTLLEQIVPTVNALLLTRAVGLELTFLDALRVMPIATFFSRLPISVEAIGVREGLYVALFSFFGVTPAAAVAMALAARVVDLFVVGLGTLAGTTYQRVVAGLQPQRQG